MPQGAESAGSPRGLAHLPPPWKIIIIIFIIFIIIIIIIIEFGNRERTTGPKLPVEAPRGRLRPQAEAAIVYYYYYYYYYCFKKKTLRPALAAP